MGMAGSGRGMAGALALSGLWAALVILWRWDAPSPDLNALWFAGRFLAEGRPGLVYAIDPLAFPAVTDPDWRALAASLGCAEPCAYPYVYPPLWAALVAPLTGWLGPSAFSNAVLLVQVPAFALCPLLAWRLWRPAAGPAAFTALGLLLVTLSTAGPPMLANNQPQMAVTVLVLLALERQAAGRPVQGGLALALAAALKLYPVLFALLWLPDRDWRALRAVAAGGAALGLASLALGGLGLHAGFLDALATLSAQPLPSNLNHALPSLGPWLDPAGWAAVKAGAAPGGLPALSAALGPAVLVLGLLLLALRLRGKEAAWRRRVGGPALAALAALSAPVGWSYHFVIPLLALPLLPALWPGRAGVRLAVLLGLLMALPVRILLRIEDWGGSGAAALAGAAFGCGVLLALLLAPYRPAASTS